jgi:putative membrane protein
MAKQDRWPGWVYGAGEEPDYRFSFANERTFLAWIRTSLALLAAGVALDAISLSVSPEAQRALASLFVGLGLLCALAAWFRWARAERSMRRGEPLPPPTFTGPLTGVLVVASVTLLVLLV